MICLQNWIVFLAVLTLCGGVSGAAVAHPLAPSLLELVENADDGITTVRWKLPPAGMPGAVLEGRFPDSCTPLEAPAIQRSRSGIVRTWRMACQGGLVGGELAVAGLAESKSTVVLRVSLRDGRELTSVLRSDAPSWVVPDREAPKLVATSYVTLGSEHILSGLDHLLFLVGVLLLVKGARRLFATITMFTLGHTLTLALTALDWVSVPQQPVEVLIAASICVLAVELARSSTHGNTSSSILARHPWPVALAFGLLHGFGFAGALSEIGLPAGQIPLALFSFNLGIEIGQLAFVGVALGAAMLVRAVTRRRPGAAAARARRRPLVNLAAAYALGVLSVYWMLDRGTGALGLSRGL